MQSTLAICLPRSLRSADWDGTEFRWPSRLGPCCGIGPMFGLSGRGGRLEVCRQKFLEQQEVVKGFTESEMVSAGTDY